MEGKEIGKHGYHTGIDLVSTNEIVYSPCFGKVSNISFDASYGNYVDIYEATTKRHHWLCHLRKINVSIGDELTPLKTVGIMGMTGRATGVHVHYEIRLESNKYGRTINPTEHMKIPNMIGKYNSNNYLISDSILKTLAKSTNLRNSPTINSTEKTLYLEGTTLYVIKPNYIENDGYVWDKVQIRVNEKQGYMINKNYK